MRGHEANREAVSVGSAVAEEPQEAGKPRGEPEPPDRAKPEPSDGGKPEPDEFAFIVSHDLKQPLQGIRAYCEILLDDYEAKLDAEGRRRLRALATMCDRLAGSIDSLLEYCRVGRMERLDARVDLNAVAGDVLQTFRPILDATPGSVRVVAPLPVVRGDALLIGKVLANLISNGLKFNQSETPRVEIGPCADDPPAIYVRDNGIGIPGQYHEEIFAIFRRLHGRARYEGSGAGLTIVRKIVELHGGRVWLESEPGRGTTFFFTLSPARDEATSAPPPTQPPHWSTRPSGRAGRQSEAGQERAR
jgi:light-regulated signal transduction histidine kinase (bacteriophytochrome)